MNQPVSRLPDAPESNKVTEQFAGAVIKGLVDITASWMEQSAADYEERMRQEREVKRTKAVAMIEEAVATGERISRLVIDDILHTSRYTKQELADKLGMSLEFLNAGLKCWYRFW